MLCVCGGDVMDVVFSVCIVRRGAVGARVCGMLVFRHMFVSCAHPVAVINAAFCMTCRLLMLVEDAIYDHTEEAYSGLITALLVAMGVSFCLPHPDAVIYFMICRGLCACNEMLWMLLYVSFGSKVRRRTIGYLAMGSALLFIVRFIARIFCRVWCEQSASCFVWI